MVILSSRGGTVVYTVGTKGQIVISKEIRDKLGIKPGWLALQRLHGDHLEVTFIPPEHDRSLLGALSKYTNVTVSSEDWHTAKESAWAAAVREKFLSDEEAN